MLRVNYLSHKLNVNDQRTRCGAVYGDKYKTANGGKASDYSDSRWATPGR